MNVQAAKTASIFNKVSYTNFPKFAEQILCKATLDGKNFNNLMYIWFTKYFTIMCRKFELSPVDNPLYGHSPSFYIFLWTPHFWEDFDNIAQMKYRINTQKLTWQSYFLIFKRLKNNVTCFFNKQHFYKQPGWDLIWNKNNPQWAAPL